MKRYNLYFSEDLIKELKKESERSGVPVSEIVRRASKEYLIKVSKKFK